MFADWAYPQFYCKLDTINNNNAEIIAKKANDLIPVLNGPCNGCQALDVKIFYATLPSCVDCKSKGGSNIRPSFWSK